MNQPRADPDYQHDATRPVAEDGDADDRVRRRISIGPDNERAGSLFSGDDAVAGP